MLSNIFTVPICAQSKIMEIKNLLNSQIGSSSCIDPVFATLIYMGRVQGEDDNNNMYGESGSFGGKWSGELRALKPSAYS